MLLKKNLVQWLSWHERPEKTFKLLRLSRVQIICKLEKSQLKYHCKPKPDTDDSSLTSWQHLLRKFTDADQWHNVQLPVKNSTKSNFCICALSSVWGKVLHLKLFIPGWNSQQQQNPNESYGFKEQWKQTKVNKSAILSLQMQTAVWCAKSTINHPAVLQIWLQRVESQHPKALWQDDQEQCRFTIADDGCPGSSVVDSAHRFVALWSGCVLRETEERETWVHRQWKYTGWNNEGLKKPQC